MKLSELIAFRNRLEELPVGEAKRAADLKLNILMHTINQPHELSMLQLTQPFIPTLEAKIKEIYAAFDNFNVSIEQVKQHVRGRIAEQEKHWFQESYRLFEGAEECERTDQILYGRTVAGEKSELTLQAEETLRARLSAYSDWRFPGMIIRPGIENFVETMVGCDPLYIIDREHDLLKPCLDRFPPLYQNRLRPYITNDWSDQLILDKIPNNQFGICLAGNVFNYRPLEIIRRYLEEIYTKLRPGGVLLMTYNDCDRAPAVILVEQFCTSYTPGYLIRDLVQDVGFEQTYTWDDGGPSVWLELKKPGMLTGNRGGQAVATVRRINDYSDDVDYRIRKVYTEDELIELKLTLTKKYNLDKMSNAKWEEILGKILGEKEAKETKIRLEKEAEERRVKLEEEEEFAKSIDRLKKEELQQLRQRAMELNAGDPNLIRYGYSAEKLKHLIKQKEEENK